MKMVELNIQFVRAPRAIQLVDTASALPADAPDEAEKAAKAAEAARALQAEQERAAVEQTLESLAAAVNEFDTHRRELLREMQQLAIELATTIAGQLMHRQVETGEFPIESMVAAAIARFEPKGPIVVRLHPDDLAALERRLGNQTTSATGPTCRVEPDAAIERGNCRVEAGELSVLSHWNAHRDEIRQHLLDALAHAEVERRKTAAGDSGLRRFPDRRQTA
jgi:flagellar assembly protein FliH